jgi:transposase-like protein
MGIAQERRESLVRRLLNGESVSELSKETGLGSSTLYGWRLRAQRGAVDLSKGKKERWSNAQKLTMLAQSASFNEAELSEYCRKNGVYVEQLKQWRGQAEQGLGAEVVSSKQHREALEAERKLRQELERELRRKEKALAETAALLTLRKKAQAIWGEAEEE